MTWPQSAGSGSTHIAHAREAWQIDTDASASASSRSLAAKSETLEELLAAQPERIFETGSRWQIIPAKLFRYEDRLTYLRGSFPALQAEQIAVLPLPSLAAVALFDRHSGLPEPVASGNHVAELFLAASTLIAADQPNHAIAFFIEDKLWLILAREGRTVFVHAHRILSDTDAVFYIAADLQHFGLLRQATTLFVGGHILPLGSLYRQLTIYFEVVDLADAFDHAERSSSEVELLLAYQRGLRSLNPSA